MSEPAAAPETQPTAAKPASWLSRSTTALTTTAAAWRTRLTQSLRQRGQDLRHFASASFDSAIRGAIRAAFRLVYRARFKGMENFDAIKGQPTVIIANHTSLLDGVLLAAALPVQPAFAIATDMYEKLTKNPLIKFLFNRMTMLPIDSTKPQAIKTMARLAQSGTPVMIFPEGRLTSTGSMMQIFDGASAVADAADAHIVPVHIKGLHFLPFGTISLRNFPRRLFPDISATALKPRKLDLPDSLSPRDRRKARHAQLENIMRGMPQESLDPARTLMDELHVAARHFGHKTPIIEDHLRNKLTYREVITGAYALGAQLKKLTGEKENVGFLLPNSNAAAVTFWALHAHGRVPTMLNASSDAPTLESCTHTASLKTVVTSRAFVEIAKLEPEIEALQKTCKIVYLEDIKGRIGLAQKLYALGQARGLLPRPGRENRGSHPAVILFTSGSEGPPKGVVLSSTNLLSNIAQVSTVTPIGPNDKVFNALPVFHSFGLGGGMLMPMILGIPSAQYPTPLDGKTIPKAIYWSDATVMFGTDTFLTLYARGTDSNADMNRLRLVFAGAEALSKETYDTYIERFGVKIYQGYGMTEASPVVSINVPAFNENGTVGKFVPGLQSRLEPVPDMDNAYRLFLKGPNIMLGYLKNENPGVLYPPQDGWHDTGDIVTMTEKGFVKLAGRAKRFAKIGGEMVSLDGIEAIARAASAPDKEQAVILRQDEGKGDVIVLYTTDENLRREQLGKAAAAANRSLLGLPKNDEIRFVPEIPKLGSGKTDYVTLKKLESSFNAAARKPDDVQPAPAAAAPGNDNAQPKQHRSQP